MKDNIYPPLFCPNFNIDTPLLHICIIIGYLVLLSKLARISLIHVLFAPERKTSWVIFTNQQFGYVLYFIKMYSPYFGAYFEGLVVGILLAV
jgi:hypothetical protein